MLLSEGYCTTWANARDVLLPEEVSPRYCAVTGCVPTAMVDLVRVATPPLNKTVPSLVVPSMNLTEPVGVAPVDETVAVKVTA